MSERVELLSLIDCKNRKKKQLCTRNICLEKVASFFFRVKKTCGTFYVKRRVHIKGQVLWGRFNHTSYLNFSVEGSKRGGEEKTLKEIKYLLSSDEKYQQVHFHIPANLRTDGITMETDLRPYTHTQILKL